VYNDHGGRGTLEVWCWPFIRRHAEEKRLYEINFTVKFKLFTLSTGLPSDLIQIVPLLTKKVL